MGPSLGHAVAMLGRNQSHAAMRERQARSDEGAQHIEKMAVVSSVCKALQGCSTRFSEGGCRENVKT
jgi:hypothetical protein